MRCALFILLLTAAASVNAEAAACTACTRVDALTKSAKALNYSNDDDQVKGQDIVNAGTIELSDFGKVAKTDPNRQSLFRSLLNFVREAGPYDGESSLADLLAGQLLKDPSLDPLYSSFLKTAPESPRAEYCKSQRLATSVKEDLCLKKAGVTGQDVANEQQEQRAEKCIQAFNYDSCLTGH